MPDDTTATFPFPAVSRKKITAAFDGGRLSSDGGVMLLAQAERRLGIAERLARVIPDRRDPARLKHAITDMIRARIFAIACGYEDCNDFGPLRADPAFKLACGHLPETGPDLASQPTLSRLENAPTIRDAIRLTYALIDQWMESYPTVPDGIVLDIDDTCDVVHGHQQLSLFNAHYDERCFLPIHVYDSATGRPVAIVLRPGKTPSGLEVRAHLRRLVRRIRTRWPTTRITIRGDSHYARPEVMDFCEQNGLSYLFGLAGTRPLTAKVQDVADAVRTRRAVKDREVVRDFAETTHRARSSSRGRPHRGDSPGARHPLCRHQPQGNQPARRLREPVLCSRPGRELDQVPQGATRLRPDVVPPRGGQPGPPGAAYGSLLADAGGAGDYSGCTRPRPGGVRNAAASPAQDCRAGAGNHQPDPACLCLVLPGRGSLPSSGRGSPAQPEGGLALSDGAAVAPVTPGLLRQRVPTFQTSPR